MTWNQRKTRAEFRRTWCLFLAATGLGSVVGDTHAQQPYPVGQGTVIPNYVHEAPLDSSCEPSFRGGYCDNYCLDLWGSYCWERPHGHALASRHFNGSHHHRFPNLLRGHQGRCACEGSCQGNCDVSCATGTCNGSTVPQHETSPAAPPSQPAPPAPSPPVTQPPASASFEPSVPTDPPVWREVRPEAVIPQNSLPTDTLETEFPNSQREMMEPPAPPAPPLPTDALPDGALPTNALPVNPLPANPLPDNLLPENEGIPFKALPSGDPVPPLPADLSTPASASLNPFVPQTTPKNRVKTASGASSEGTTRLLRQLRSVSQ